MPGAKDRLPFVLAQKAKGKLYLYYRRDGRRVPLPGPEGSAAFRREYDNVHAAFEAPVGSTTYGRHTVGAAIGLYLNSADFKTLSEVSKRNYRYYLDAMASRSGQVLLADMTAAWVEALRDRLASQPHYWNGLRARMKTVVDGYMRRHEDLLGRNPWERVKRLPTQESEQNRDWPDDVLIQVMRAATPEFRALITTMLLTAQRIEDVVAFRPDQYDALRGVLRFQQRKTRTFVTLHVPIFLARTFNAMYGRLSDRLLVTPRGLAWTTTNAQETMLSMRRRLGIPRYTLHGLRATGPTALAMQGHANRSLRAITGHDTDDNLEQYLRGVQNLPLAVQAQEALQERYTEVLEGALEGANQRSYAGVTGKAAANAGVRGEARKGKQAVQPP